MPTGAARKALIILVIAAAVFGIYRAFTGLLAQNRIYTVDEYTRKFGASPTGVLRTDPGISSATLEGDKAAITVSVDDGVAEVPEGEWVIGSWTRKAADAAGVEWALTLYVSKRAAQRGLGQTRASGDLDIAYEAAPIDRVTIEAGGETSYKADSVRGTLNALPLGDATQRSTNGYYFTQELTDTRGRLAALRRTRPGNARLTGAPELPRLRISNAAGTYNRTFDFQYG